ncbi:MAG TPA: ATP-binding protein [Acidimicrobiales bacterium]|nr:ATP-binding protein [Acidimicrobiales bacterium]
MQAMSSLRGADPSTCHVADDGRATAEKRYQMLLESSPVAIFHAGFDGELLYVNRKWCEIAGRSLQRISVPTWRSVIHPDDVEDAESRLRRAFETGADFEEDFRLLTPLGEVRWVAVRSVPFSVTDERSVGRLGTMENVSERHVAQEALQRSEELHRSVIEGMSEGIYVQAADGLLIESNPAARRLVGTASGDLRDVVVVQEDGTSLKQRQFPAAVALRTGAFCSNLIVGVQDPVRGLRWLTASAQPLRRNDARGPWAAVCTFSDVTDQREVDRMKSEFISVVSHEIRTPLTAIKGALGLVASGAAGSLSEDAQKLVDLAATNTDRLARLVSDMLDLERIESGRITLVRADIDLSEILRQAITIMTPIAERDGVEIVADETQVRVTVDSDRIIQTVTNLLSNAVKFSPSGSSVIVHVDEQLTVGQQNVTIRVIDRGRGVPPDQLDDIFLRFHQVDASDSRDRGGTGLGLAICKDIVEEHDGDIWMEATPGGGATCVFTLPLSRTAI